jgi:hypothetical protein
VHPIEFLKKHAKPHIIVAHYDPLDHQDENGIGPVTYRIAPSIVMNTLDLAGECTDMIDPEACTLNVMFELGEDAAKLRLATQIDRFRNARQPLNSFVGPSALAAYSLSASGSCWVALALRL